jgi:FMN phosphatase YigB (HAD superfamily)
LNKLIGNEQNVFFDCDDTLVMRNDNEWCPKPARLKFVEPLTEEVYYLSPHIKHIQILKELYERGFTIIVWSAAGPAWAKVVVERLNLTEYVHYHMSKPVKFFDDLPANEILGTRVYIKQNG